MGTKFYTFSQNNSGGQFDENLSQYVIIEASSAKEANRKAREIGVYFNGIDEGYDCECCGDRWVEVCEEDATEKPSVYGEHIKDNTDDTTIYRRTK